MNNPNSLDDNNENLIDFSDSSSDSSSDEVYVPSTDYDSDDSRKNILEAADSTLNKINDSVDKVNRTLAETRHFLRSRSVKEGEKKANMSKSSFMTTKQALDLIPIFDGESSDTNHAFINACEYALENIDPTTRDSFVKGITTRLTGKAYRAIRYKEFKSFQELKTILGSLVDKRHTLAQLHAKLAVLRFSMGETIQQYADRAEQLYYDILEVSSASSGLKDVEGIEKITAMQILTAFTEGLPHDTKIIVKACRPTTLSEAVLLALEEETSRRAQKEIYQHSNMHRPKSKFQSSHQTRQSVNKPAGACFLCGRSNHLARDCRASDGEKNRYKNSRVKDIGEQRNVRVITCRYCKKSNHTIEECRKRKYVNDKKERDRQDYARSSTQEGTSGNEQTPGASGGRPVGQIKTATLSMQELSISKPN